VGSEMGSGVDVKRIQEQKKVDVPGAYPWA